MMSRLLTPACLVVACMGSALGAQPAFDVEQISCLPLENNAVLRATVGSLEGGDEVRLYFRRLSPVGAFYYVAMLPSGAGKYWTTFPQAEDREQQHLTDEWYDILKDRDWMQGHDRDWLDDYLRDQGQEAAEYYVAVIAGDGAVRGRSKTMLTSVRGNDCFEPLTPQQAGLAQNLTIGETSSAQEDKEVFHWLCAGIVTRIDPMNVLHPDEYCRACVVGFGFVPPIASAAAGVVSGVIITQPPTEASPRQP
jgi:hypothetical protein